MLITYEELCCPITKQMFHYPATGQDGIVYERTALRELLLSPKPTSPITGQPFDPEFKLLTSTIVAKAVERWVGLHPDAQPELPPVSGRLFQDYCFLIRHACTSMEEWNHRMRGDTPEIVLTIMMRYLGSCADDHQDLIAGAAALAAMTSGRRRASATYAPTILSPWMLPGVLVTGLAGTLVSIMERGDALAFARAKASAARALRTVAPHLALDKKQHAERLVMRFARDVLAAESPVFCPSGNELFSDYQFWFDILTASAAPQRFEYRVTALVQWNMGDDQAAAFETWLLAKLGCELRETKVKVLNVLEQMLSHPAVDRSRGRLRDYRNLITTAMEDQGSISRRAQELLRTHLLRSQYSRVSEW
jgi:hypothetical protein